MLTRILCHPWELQVYLYHLWPSGDSCVLYLLKSLLYHCIMENEMELVVKEKKVYPYKLLNKTMLINVNTTEQFIKVNKSAGRTWADFAGAGRVWVLY